MMKIMLFAMTVLCVSCGPASKLRRAQRLIDNAIARGAKADTTWNDVKFVAPEIRFSTSLDSPNWQDTVHIIDPNTKVEVKIKRVIVSGEPEKVYIEGKCPPQAVDVPCPTAMKISAGYTLWDLFILALICLTLGRYLWPIIENSIRSLRSKK